MACLILAAGRGSRLAELSESKPLTPLLGIPLIERVILTAMKSGLREFHVVTGYQGDSVREFLDTFSIRENVRIVHVINNEWERGSGLSVLKAKPFIKGNFVLLMSDHLFDASILNRIQHQSLAPGELILAVDYKTVDSENVDPLDVKRVQVVDGRIVDIGRNISPYNAFDTGIFLCSASIFEALEEAASGGNDSFDAAMSILANQKKARAFDIGDCWWIDVDDRESLKKAEELLMRAAIDRRSSPHLQKRHAR